MVSWDLNSLPREERLPGAAGLLLPERFWPLEAGTRSISPQQQRCGSGCEDRRWVSWDSNPAPQTGAQSLLSTSRYLVTSESPPRF